MCQIVATFINRPGAFNAADNSGINLTWHNSQNKKEDSGTTYRFKKHFNQQLVKPVLILACHTSTHIPLHAPLVSYPDAHYVLNLSVQLSVRLVLLNPICQEHIEGISWNLPQPFIWTQVWLWSDFKHICRHNSRIHTWQNFTESKRSNHDVLTSKL